MRRISWLFVTVLTLASGALLIQPSRASEPPPPDRYPTGWTTPDEYIGLRIGSVEGPIDVEASSIRLDGQALETWESNGFLNAYPPRMTAGAHEASAVLVDEAGAERIVAWTFTVDGDAAWIERSQQSPTGVISDRTPLISVPAWDLESGVRAEYVHVQIARKSTLQEVSSTHFGHYDEAAQMVSYQVPDVPSAAASIGSGPLPDGEYFVLVTVNDNAGWTSITTWSFTVKALPVEVPFGY